MKYFFLYGPNKLEMNLYNLVSQSLAKEIKSLTIDGSLNGPIIEAINSIDSGGEEVTGIEFHGPQFGWISLIPVWRQPSPDWKRVAPVSCIQICSECKGITTSAMRKNHADGCKINTVQEVLGLLLMRNDRNYWMNENIGIENSFFRIFGVLIDFEFLRAGFRERAVQAFCGYRGIPHLLLDTMAPINNWDLTCTHVTLFESEDENLIFVCSPDQDFVNGKEEDPTGFEYHEDALGLHRTEYVCEKCNGFIYETWGHSDECPHQVILEVLKS